MSEEGRYIKGGGGSHWVGCEETHWDCKIARLEKENARLQKAVEEAERIFTTRFHMAFGMYSISTKDIETWLKEYGKG